MLVRVRKVRTEMAVLLKEVTPLLEINTITLSVVELNQSRAGEHELYYQGDLYDIVKISQLKGEKVAVSVLCDVREQVLLTRLGLCLEHSDKQNASNPITRFFVKILNQTYILPLETGLSFIKPAEKSNQPFIFKDMHSLFQPYVNTPPPWLV